MEAQKRARLSQMELKRIAAQLMNVDMHGHHGEGFVFGDRGSESGAYQLFCGEKSLCGQVLSAFSWL